jgi:hypothetical protein
MNRGKVNFVYGCICAVIFTVAGAHVQAQILTADQYSGRATGINAVLTTNGTPTTVTAGDTCPLSPRGGTSTSTTAGILIPGTLGSGTISSSASASGITSQASTNVASFFLRAGGWTFSSPNINVTTQCNCCDIANPGCSAQLNIGGFTVTDPSGANVPITVSGAANQVVTLPGGIGTITFNERTSSPGSLTVTGAHINVNIGGTNYNVLVGTAHADIVCPGLAPTSELVNVSGRVVDSGGNAISRATVTITNSQGTVVRTTTSSVNGDYTLTSIETGSTYIVAASHRSYDFTPRSLNLLSEVSGFNLVGTPK